MPHPALAAANARWSMEVVSDALADGRPFPLPDSGGRLHTRMPGAQVAHSLPAFRVIQVLDGLATMRGLPASIVCDNAPAFSVRAFDLWAHRRGVALQFIRPGTPLENAYIESLNGCLNAEGY